MKFVVNRYKKRAMKKIKFSIIILAVIVLSAACLKVEKVSEIPSIKFISFEIADTTDIQQNRLKAGILKFRFEDGDGDIGMNSQTGTDTVNLKLSLYRKIDEAMQPVTDNKDPLLPGSDYTIPYMETVGQSKVLRGEVVVSISYMSYNQADTIMYDFYIIDRAGNHSNIEETAEIIVSEKGVYKKE